MQKKLRLTAIIGLIVAATEVTLICFRFRTPDNETGQMDLWLTTVTMLAATLMGFAFLTPVVQGMSSGLFTRATTTITPKILYQRILGLTSLPICLFFWSLLSSLLLYAFWSEPTRIAVRELSIGLASYCALCWLPRIRRVTKFQREPATIGGVAIALQVVLIVYALVYAFVSFPHHIYATHILFMCVGVLLLLHNLMVPFDKGITFKRSEMKQGNSQNQGYREEVGAGFERIEKALQERQRIVAELEEVPLADLPAGWWMRHYEYLAKHDSEIRLLDREYRGSQRNSFKSLQQRWHDLNWEQLDAVYLPSADTDDLDNSFIPRELKRGLEYEEVPLASDSAVKVEKKHDIWEISNTKTKVVFCIVERKDGELNAYIENRFTLSDVFDFDDDRSEMLREYILQFERATDELTTLVKMIKCKLSTNE